MAIVGGKAHTSTDYENELAELRRLILEIGAKVEFMVAKSMESVVLRDSDLAQEIIESDREVDGLDADVSDLSIKMMALRQPAAVDLRFIATAMKIAGSLERIGDLAVNVAERALELNKERPLKPYIELPNMAEATRKMLRESLDSFVNGDAKLALRVIESDDLVDNFNEELFRELLTYMMEDPRTIGRAQRLTFVSKYLERIADHSSSIGKAVYFMVEGKFPPRRQIPPKEDC